MSTVKNLFFFLVISSIIFSCSKEDAYIDEIFEVRDGETILYYNETQCDDPWYEASELFRSNSDYKVAKLVSFLAAGQFEVIAAKYTFDASSAIACTACYCQTGGVFYILIGSEEEKISQLVKLGFFKY